MAENKTVRRIVVIDENEKSRAIADGPSPDVRTDPARPGFASTRIWLTDRTPARIEGCAKRDAARLSRRPARCRVVVSAGRTKESRREGSAGVFRFDGLAGRVHVFADAPHPYMQKTQTLDFCLVIEGEITLVLDTEEVQLKQATPSSSAAPITRGATAPTSRA